MSIAARMIVLAGIFIPTLGWTKTEHHPEPAGFSCPGDEKVWVNIRSGIYHLAGERYYGSTREGRYECKKAADEEGDRETRNGQ